MNIIGRRRTKTVELGENGRIRLRSVDIGGNQWKMVEIDKGEATSAMLDERLNIMNDLTSLENNVSLELAQKAKIKWVIEGDENSNLGHGIINKHRNNLAVRGIIADGEWIEEPNAVKNKFFSHFRDRFNRPCKPRLTLDMEFPNKLSTDQSHYLERPFFMAEVKGAVYWSLIEDDVLEAVNYFFNMATAIKEKKQTMIFKVDFEKAFDSVRWDFLDDVMENFSFVMESLNLSLHYVVSAGLFKGVNLDNSLQLSHLFYADDVIFVGQLFDSNLFTIIWVLDCIFHASGLRINLHKSKLIGIDVDQSMFEAATSNIGCMALNLPFSYLGIIIGSNMSRIKAWDDVINKVLCQLSKWKMKILSIGGRFTLLKSVLASNEKDGLGVLSFYALNRALTFKWIWRFRTHGCSLWSRVIKLIHGEDGIDLLGYIKKKTGNGENTLFWGEMAHSSLASSLRRKPRGGIEQVQMANLISNLEGFTLPNMHDRRRWSFSADGECLVASVRNLIDDRTLAEVGTKTR
nr:RNA-directed DNA polymerase, eukaryota [Tanacetum cinerariifolium]